MKKLRGNLLILTLLLVGLSIFALGVSGTAATINLMRNDVYTDQPTLVTIYSEQTATLTCSSSMGEVFYWYLDGAYVSGDQGYSTTFTTPSNLAVGDHSVICEAEYRDPGQYVEFTVRVIATPTPTPTLPPQSTPNPNPSSTPTPTVYTQPTPSSGTAVTLTINISGLGTVSPSVGLHSYNLQETAYLVAVPSAGYQFKYWLFDDYNKLTTPTVNLAMTRSRTAMAVFTEIPTDPNATPISTPEPTPIPLPDTTPTPTIQPTAPYVNVNEAATVWGIAQSIFCVLGFLVYNKKL